MPPKKDTPSMSGTAAVFTLDDLVAALRDERVLEHFGTVVETKIQPVLLHLTEIDKEFTKLRQAFQEVSNKVDKLEQNTDSELKRIDHERKVADDRVKLIEKELQSANNKLATLENYSRLDNLIITGLPIRNYADAGTATNAGAGVESNGSTEEAVLELVNYRLGLQLSKADISTTHRLKKKPSSSSPAPVIVRFANRRAREAVYAARRKLKVSTPLSMPQTEPLPEPVYINEDLTKVAAEVFRQARKMAKEHLITSTWTSGGTVYIRKTSDPFCKPQRVVTAAELQACLVSSN
jgi:hypothetical protein